MFNGIIKDSGFTKAVSAAVTLYVIVYAILFTFGMVQLTVYDFFLRMVKIGIIGMLLNGTAWSYFSATFIHFFNDGTDEIISAVSTIAIGGTPTGGLPFDFIDKALVEAVSTKMLITLMAAALTGPYGFVIIAILTIALWGFLKSVLNALWIYIMALVMRTLLFGLAPIFIACIMFSRTRQLFDGWLNQVLNSCLQPIFLFTFFAFFVQLIKVCLDQLVSLDVCWTEWSETLRGAPFAEHYWRFAIWDCNLNIWVPFDGSWGFTGPDNTGCTGNPVHPVGIMLPITLWMLSDLGSRFSHIAVRAAQDISNVSMSFAYQGGMGGGGGGGGGGGSGGDKGKPGGAPGGKGITTPGIPTGRLNPTGSRTPSATATNQTGTTFADVQKRFKQFGDLANRPRRSPGE